MSYLFSVYNEFPLNKSFHLDTNQAVNNSITSSSMKTEDDSSSEECKDDSNSMNDINKDYSEDIFGRSKFLYDKMEGQEDNSEIASSRSEIHLLKSAQSEIIDVKEDANYYYFIMEYCQYGELFLHIVNNRRLDEKQASFFFFQIINPTTFTKIMSAF